MNDHRQQEWPHPDKRGLDDEPERIHPIVWIATSIGAGVVVALIAFFIFVSVDNNTKSPDLVQKEEPADPGATSQIDHIQSPALVSLPVLAPKPPDLPEKQEDPIPVTEVVPHAPAIEDTELETVDVAVLSRLNASDVYELVSPSVLLIQIYDARSTMVAKGSGFLISDNGDLVTNLHVVEGAVSATASFPDGSLARVLGYSAVDRLNDLALLKILSDKRSTALKIDEELPRVGTSVYAIGSPIGLTNSLSDGIVSGHRKLESGTSYIQTNAAISHGSSGGPLVNEYGHVVGVTTAYLEGGQNLNLAVPSHRISVLLNSRGPLKELVSLSKSQNLPVSMNDDHVTLRRVTELIRAKEFGRALSILGEIPSTRRGAGYWVTLGEVHYGLGNMEEAFHSFGQAVKLQPDCAALLKLASAAKAISRSKSGVDNPASVQYWLAAKEASHMATRVDPASADAWIFYGYMTVLEDQKAVGAFKTASAMEPTNLAAKYNLGLMHLVAEDSANAEQAFSEALSLSAASNDYYFEPLSWGGEDITKWSQSRSIKVMILLNLGKSCVNQRKFAEAVKHYEVAAEIEPGNPVICWLLCLAHRQWRQNLKDPTAMLWEKRANGDHGSYEAVTFGGGRPLLFKK